MRVLVAPDKFKGSLSATQVAEAMARGVRRACPSAHVSCTPVADGGDGFLDVVLAHVAGAAVLPVRVRDAVGRDRGARVVLAGATAYVEAAEAVSVTHQEPGPQVALRADSHGVGQLVLTALDAGADRVVVGLGGTATSDAGAGLLRALGVALLDPAGGPVGVGGGALEQVASVDVRGLDPRLRGTRLVAALDVSNPLLGPDGAVDVFAPQKGADQATLAVLRRGFEHWHQVWRSQTGLDLDLAGGGAAGGLGAALVGVLGAEPVAGADMVLDLCGVRELLPDHDLVLTGEGSFDTQSLTGKGPHAVVTAAERAAVPVGVVAGRCSLTTEQLASLGLVGLRSLQDVYEDPFADPGRKVEEQTAELVRHACAGAVRSSGHGAP